MGRGRKRNHKVSLVSRALYKFGRLLCYTYLRLRNDLKLYGLENIPAGPVVLACNHASYMDPVLVSLAFPHAQRAVRWMAWDILFRVPVLGFLIRNLGAFPIRPEGVDRAGLRKAQEILRGGGIVGIFPEGGRTVTGRFGAARPGFVRIALRAGASIVPVVIKGSFEAWPMQQLFPGPGKIRVYFMPAIYGGERLPDRDAQEAVRAKLEAIHAG